MKAVIRTKAGGPDVLRIVDLEKPTPSADQVLIKVHAATVTRGDAIMLGLPGIMTILMRLMLGYRKKKSPGTEYSGVVEEVGSSVSKFSVGDEVYGLTTMEKMGAQAEYLCVSQDGIISFKPKKADHKTSASVIVGAMTALQLLEKRDIAHKKEVLIYGASGSVGSFAVQVAKNYGARVTGVSSTGNMEMVKSLGADEVLDYTSSDFEQYDKKYDLIFDAVNKMSGNDKKRLLDTNGSSITSMASTKERIEDLDRIASLVDEGKLKSFIDHEYPLDEIAEAYRITKSGRKRGNIVINIV